MAGRGSLVGDAYIRVHADTRFMAREIRRDAIAAGKLSGDEYSNNFSKRLMAKRIQIKNAARDALSEALVSGDFDRLFKKSGVTIDEFTAGITRDLKKMSKQGRISNLDLSDSLTTLDRWQNRAAASARKLAEEVSAKKVATEMAQHAKAVERQSAAWATYGRNLLVGTKNMRNGETRLGRFTNAIRRGSDRMDLFAIAAGRAFGKGSRNNFLNFTGTVVKGLADFMVLPLKGLGHLIDGVHDLGAQFSALRANGSSFASALTQTLAPAIGSAALGLAGLGIAIGLTAFALPLLTSALLLLAGAITAVVGAITIGLIGALLPIGPIILAALAGLTPLIFFFRDLKKEMRGATAVVKSMNINLDRLAKKVRPAMMKVATETAALFAQITKSVGPFISQMALVGAEIVHSLRNALRDPDTKRFLRAFGTTLPKIFRSLGFGLNELGIGLIAFFKPILPFALKLADNFNSLMTTFRIWAESGKGQNSIAHFMDVAWTAANHLWHILSSVVSILGKVFLAGTEGPGGDFLKWLDDTLTKFDKWLNTPEGKTAIEGFFVRVRDFMIGAKKVAGDLLTAVGKITSPESQKELNDLIDAMGTLSGAVSTLAGWLNTVHALLSDPATFAIAGDPAAAMNSKFQGIFQVLSVEVPLILAGLILTVQRTISQIPAIILSFVAPIAGAIAAPFIAGWQQVQTAVGGIFQTIISAGWVGAAAAAVAGIVATIGHPFLVAYQTVASWIATIRNAIRNGGFVGAAAAVVAGVAVILFRPFITAWQTISGWIANIRKAISGGDFRGAAARAVSGLAAILVAPFAGAWATISGIISQIKAGIQTIIDLANRVPVLRNIVPGTASGGVFTGPTKRLIGEAGPEAVVPLDRPLSLVDPSVRWLSAIAQGETGSMASGGVATAGRVVNIAPGAITVVTPARDPAVVAGAMLDRLVAKMA